MRKMKKLINVIFMMMCVVLLSGNAKLQASANNITVYVDCNGGTYLTVGYPDRNTFDAEFVVPSGSTISAADHTIIGDSPTAIGKDFLGWNVYDASGNQVGSLWNAAQVNSYVITETTKFVAQWKDRDPAYTSEAIYFLMWDHNKDTVDYTVKVSIIYGGVKYSGYGFVMIHDDIYNTWKGSFDVIAEGNGHYIRENRKWVESSISSFSLREFRHMNNISYQVSDIAKGSDTSPLRKSINEFIYSIGNVAPEITVLDSITTETIQIHVDRAGSALPEDMIVRAEKYVSGTQLDEIAALIHTAAAGETMAVYDIEIADASGNVIHNAGSNVKVDLDLPADYQVPEGKQVVVYYVSEDGRLETCATTLHTKDDGTPYVTFETNHFSVYAVAEIEKPKPTPEPTPEPTPTPAPETTSEPSQEATIESTSEATTESTEGIENSDDSESVPKPEKGVDLSAILGWFIALVIIILAILFVMATRKRK